MEFIRFPKPNGCFGGLSIVIPLSTCLLHPVYEECPYNVNEPLSMLMVMESHDPYIFFFVFEHRFAKIGGEVNKMFRKSNLQQLIQQLKTDERFSDQIGHWHTIEEKQADTVDFPGSLDPRIRHALEVRGIGNLYTHQRSAYDLAQAGQSFTAVTPTASGKTLCYNLACPPDQSWIIPIQGHCISFQRKHWPRIRRVN